MHGVYLFKAGCCCLPVLIGCARAFLFVRAFAVQGCPVCDVIPSRKQQKVWHFSFFVSPFVITDGDMARAATSCGVVRSACGAAPNRQASSDAEAESAHLMATGGGVVASGNAPACAARLRRRGGWEHWGTRARDRGHVRRGGCGRYGCNGSDPIPTFPPAGRVLSRPIAGHGRLVVLFFSHRGRAGRQNRGAARRHGRVSSRCREGRLASRALPARLHRPLRRIRPASLYRYAAWDTHMMPSA